jgi:hypothetical protein
VASLHDHPGARRLGKLKKAFGGELRKQCVRPTGVLWVEEPRLMEDRFLQLANQLRRPVAVPDWE